MMEQSIRFWWRDTDHDPDPWFRITIRNYGKLYIRVAPNLTLFRNSNSTGAEAEAEFG